MQIALDGPSGAGKSTVAKRLAVELGCIYLDTGAMYRAVGLYAMKQGVDRNDGEGLASMMDHMDLQVQMGQGGQRLLVAGEDVTDSIRTPEVSMAASDVARHAPVRRRLVQIQRKIAGHHDVVMDGRDIGAVVLPQAEYKFFLSASPEVRARRRCDELKMKDMETDYAQVLADVITRDLQDTTRTESPLCIAQDATEVATDDLDIDEVVEVLLALMGKIR